MYTMMDTRIEEVALNLYRIEVPLPLPVVDSVNSYVIRDSDRNMIIDPGMAHHLCYDAMIDCLDQLKIDLERTDIFLTHHHLDHFGLVPRLIADDSEIFIHQTEAVSIQNIASGQTLAGLAQLLELMGFPQKDPMKVVPEMFGSEYPNRDKLPFRFVVEGDKLERGGYCFKCVVAPGHSIAHTCLYDVDRKMLIAGDAISPVLQYISISENSLGNHLNSLERLLRMDIDTVLPGHGSLFRDHRKKIASLKAHHAKKLNEVKLALEEGGGMAYQITEMIWNSTKNNEPWGTLGLLKKFFLTRDYLAHLCYLELEKNDGRD
jgi:glyoxylase-like metal-dependent hydrolase (beta-lactamase superfamily II)